ncbi:hypothetical protein D9M68_951060 [compost metagenome]
MVAQLCAQGSLDKRLLEGHRRILNRLGSHWAFDELINQLLRDRRELGFGLQGRLLFGWHTCTSSACYARTQNF